MRRMVRRNSIVKKNMEHASREHRKERLHGISELQVREVFEILSRTGNGVEDGRRRQYEEGSKL